MRLLLGPVPQSRGRMHPFAVKYYNELEETRALVGNVIL
jgi:hypothetical protein